MRLGGTSAEEHNVTNFFACYYARPCAEGQRNQAVASVDSRTSQGVW